MKKKYAECAAHEIVKGKVSEFKEEDLIPDEETMIALSYGGYIKRVNPRCTAHPAPRRKGIIGMETKKKTWWASSFDERARKHPVLHQ